MSKLYAKIERDPTDKEAAELNEIRREVGLPPLVKKERKCMRCGQTILSYNRRAWCAPCEKYFVDNEVIGGIDEV